MIEPAEVIQNRMWSRHEQPFLHIRARKVFSRDFYIALALELRNVLRRGLSEVPTPTRFSRSIPGYDAYGIGFNETLQGCLSIFVSEKWHDLIAGLFGVKGTGHINVGAHHHRIASADGTIHNDFNPAWFPIISERRVQCPKHQLCAYKTGVGSLPQSQKVEVVRAVAMIYYLANDDWVEGDGGETGLFDSPKAEVGQAQVRVPPENNSILLFECTPHSFHAFMANPVRPRNSIIMWVHSSKEDALLRWREEDLERWRI
jgi:hypothetical protein